MVNSITLASGTKIPAIGFGTGTKWYKSGDPDAIDEKVVDAVVQALEAGQYHIDTAEVYGTHAEVGLAFKKFFASHPDVKREDVFLTDKFDAKNLSPLKSVNETIKKLGVDYLDLYLIHSPFLKELAKTEDISLKQVWTEIEQLKDEGKIKAIGVSNFRVLDLEELASFAKHKPELNQIEYSLVLQNQSPGIYDYSQKHGIVLAAYSPLAPVVAAKGDKFEKLHTLLQELATKYKVSTASIALRWVTQKGVIPITTSAKKERVVESLKIFDFELTKEEVDKLEAEGKAAPIVRQYWKGFYEDSK